MPNYWLLVGEDDTWLLLLSKGFWAIKKHGRKKLEKLEKETKL
jgi:hypothetical protein